MQPAAQVSQELEAITCPTTVKLSTVAGMGGGRLFHFELLETHVQELLKDVGPSEVKLVRFAHASTEAMDTVRLTHVVEQENLWPPVAAVPRARQHRQPTGVVSESVVFLMKQWARIDNSDGDAGEANGPIEGRGAFCNMVYAIRDSVYGVWYMVLFTFCPE